MKRIFIIVVTLLTAVSVVSAQTTKTVIIPRPMEVTAVKGTYTVTAKTVVGVATAELVRPAELFADYHKRSHRPGGRPRRHGGFP